MYMFSPVLFHITIVEQYSLAFVMLLPLLD